MKKISLGLLACTLLLTSISFAQTIPQAPASWIAFQKEENAKRAAFFQEMRADREAFLSSNPDAKEYLDAVRAAAKERRTSWLASHPRKNTTNSL